jgi:hypothetical protein
VPSLNKSDVGIIRTILKNRSSKVQLTSSWQALYESYGIGRCEGKWLYFTRSDHKIWRELVIASTDFDPMNDNLTGNRTSIANNARNEKWASQSIQDNRIYCTALNSSLMLNQGELTVLKNVEYRIDYNDIQLGHYEILMVIENLEAYVYCHSFNFQSLGKALIVYRGHDQSARALLNYLDLHAGEIPVYYFCDPDPAGLAIIMDSPHATHAIIPELESLNKSLTLIELFSKQLAARPSLREQSVEYSLDFQRYVNYIINEGFARSQEWLCNKNISLKIISLI